MCGLTGFLNTTGQFNTTELQAIVSEMSNTLNHRGPDDSGVWVDETVGLALGFRRLAIIDLSPNGHQPMISACGRFIITFNGEIYNFSKLRNMLTKKGHVFLGHSDTEVILAAIVEWGVERAVKQFIGMFAFALWDRENRILSLVRDRLGIKPLYYGWGRSTFMFGSELKALRKHPDFESDIDRNSLTLLLRHNAIPSPYSIYRSVKKLSPGCILTLSPWSEDKLSPVPYWSANQVVKEQLNDPFEGSEAEAIEQLDSLLREAVRIRMVADVPLGAFLSGGVDSSTIVALMQAQSQRSVKTFSIGFYDDGYNEASYAKTVAQHLGTDHTELYITPEQAMAVIPKLPTLYDEPFSDSSQIPTFLVSELARREVTVSLSGDGGDELFAGYNRYFLVPNIWQKIGWMPTPIREKLASGLTICSPQTWELLMQKLGPILPTKFKQIRRPGDKLYKLAKIIKVEEPNAMYRELISHWKIPTEVILESEEPSTVFADRHLWPDLPDLVQRMMYFDLIGYLPNDILTKVDRASMAVSLEARVPLLDHRVVEFAWRIPLSMKIRNNQGKWLLRQVLYQYVPKNLIERPKVGFGIPLGTWLRGPLREWAESLLNESRLHQEGFFNPIPIRKKWDEHLSGIRNWQYPLWDILMFQSWLVNQSR